MGSFIVSSSSALNIEQAKHCSRTNYATFKGHTVQPITPVTVPPISPITIQPISSVSDNDFLEINADVSAPTLPDNWKERHFENEGVPATCTSISARIAKLVRILIWPFVSIYSGFCNLYHTGSWLTSTKVITYIDDELRKTHKEHFAHYTQANLTEAKATIKKQLSSEDHSKPFVTFITLQLLPRGGFVDHSAAIAIIINKGEARAILFDAQGHTPEELTLSPYANCDLNMRVDENKKTIVNIKNAQDIFKYVLDEVEVSNLLYSQESIQLDRNSCTAYVALFLKKVCEDLFSEKDPAVPFEANQFMQQIAQGKVVTFIASRELLATAATQLRTANSKP